jgi:uncharacterized protein (DUF1697 family)
MTKYVAFLRGVNLGKRQIKMAELKALLEKEGYEDVRTLLASGNVVLTAKEADPLKLRGELEIVIREKFGFHVPVILRTEKEIDTLITSDPFEGVKLTPKTRLYITLLSELPKSKLKVPYKSMGGEFVIREITNGHIVSILGPKVSSPDVMDFLGKKFGKEITTRNWNTIIKIHKAMA